MDTVSQKNVEFYFLTDPERPNENEGSISFGVQNITDSEGNPVSASENGLLYITDSDGSHAVGTFDAAKIRFSEALSFTENFGKYKPNGELRTYPETKGMSVQEFITDALTNYSITSYPRLTASISPSSARYGTTQNYNLRLTFTQGEYSTGDSSKCEVERIVIEGGNKLPSTHKEYIDGLTENGSTTIPLEAVSLLDDLSYNCTVTYTADKTGGVAEGVRIPRGTATATTSISCYDGWIICPTTNTYNTYTDDDIASIISEAAMKTTNDTRVDSYNISTGWKNLYVLVPDSTGITKWNPIDATNNSPLGNLYSENVSVAGGKNYDNDSETIEYKLFSVSNAAVYNKCTINFNWA